MGSVFARLDIADSLLNFPLGLLVQLLEILEEPLEDVLVGLTGVQLHPSRVFFISWLSWIVVAATKQKGARTYLWVSKACNRPVGTEGKVDRVGFGPPSRT